MLSTTLHPVRINHYFLRKTKSGIFSNQKLVFSFLQKVQLFIVVASFQKDFVFFKFVFVETFSFYFLWIKTLLLFRIKMFVCFCDDFFNCRNNGDGSDWSGLTISGWASQHCQLQIVLQPLDVADGLKHDVQLADVVLSGNAGNQFLQSPVRVGPRSSGSGSTLPVLPDQPPRHLLRRRQAWRRWSRWWLSFDNHCF